jgi:predicted ATPase
MSKEPAKFLHGIDTTTLSLSGLQLNEMYIPRDDEFQSIVCSYHRCVAGSPEIIVIEGESGSGKSWLAQRLGSFITAEGGVFISGKFDQMAQAKPFSALSTAFDQYCHLLMRSNDLSWVESIVDRLKAALGRDSHHLIKMIPNLGLIIENGSCHTDFSVLDISCDNALQRLLYLLFRFVEVITSSSKVSLTLFMDDVQWADDASITVMNRLLTQGFDRFFFIACCRDDEMESDHSFRKMLDSVKTSGVYATTVKLNGLDQDMLNKAIANLLHLSPRLVRPLSYIVHNKTRGNILFVSQLMLSLHRDGLLRIDFDRQRWVWDKEKILSIKLPDNIALCFTHGIIKLPVEVQLALHTLAMFGASVKSEYLELLESRLGLTLLDPLEKAAAEGLVNKLKTMYQFTHDRIQEASYNLIGGQVRLGNHMMYGKCLVQRSYETGDGDLLFMAVNQLNLAGSSNSSDPAESLAMANHNLAAGKRAMSLSDFALAHSFFMHGISFLDRDHWTEQYRFSIDLYELAIQSASAAGYIQALNILSDEVLQNARTFEDKLATHYAIMSSLLCAGKISEAVQKGLAIVSQLGEGIPINPSKDLLRKRIQQTQLQMRGLSEEDFLNYSIMTEFKKLMAMKFLARLQIMSFFINPMLSTYILMKMVDLTLSHGKTSFE